MALTVEVDDQRCMIRRQRLSLPRLAIDLSQDNALFYGVSVLLAEPLLLQTLLHSDTLA